MIKMVRMHKCSFDTCVGRARQMKLFPEHEILCTKTLYQLLWNGELPLTLFELPELTGYYISLKIDGKTIGGVSAAMELLHQQYGKHFSEVFRTITTDNGSEFADFSSAERYGCEIYFAEPYCAWERPVNERTNRLLRRFIRKGKSIQDYTDEDILQATDEINAMHGKGLGYATPEDLFEAQLDKIYGV